MSNSSNLGSSHPTKWTKVTLDHLYLFLLGFLCGREALVEPYEISSLWRTVRGDPKSFPAHSQGPAAAGQYFIDSAIASYLHISNFQGESLLHSEAFPWQPPGDTKQLFLPEWVAFFLVSWRSHSSGAPELSAPWTEDCSLASSPLS